MAQEYSFAELYREYRAWPQEPAHEHLTELFNKIKPEHRRRWRDANPDKSGYEQAWRAWKGKNFKLLAEELIQAGVLRANAATQRQLALVSEAQLKPAQIDDDLRPIRDALSVDCDSFGSYLANFDFAVYDDSSAEIVAIISCKTTLRERLVTLLFWGGLLQRGSAGRQARLVLMTLDEDQQLRRMSNQPSKNYALVNTYVDATYMLTHSFEETERIHRFSRFGEDLEKWGVGGGGKWLHDAAGARSQPRISSRRRWMGCRRSANRSMSAQTISTRYTATRRKRCASSAGAFSGWSAICSRRGPRPSARRSTINRRWRARRCGIIRCSRMGRTGRATAVTRG